ncbi:uncharacterized protein LOC133298415, partial [Gastrolobium bilobum]|uniref:uncharacterized protein LOC133298415 n=1 Tax=Gastrolobium bilobum TaxID=150636 RepID=UPI002AAF43AE
MSKHPDPTPIRFFKIIPGTSLQEGKLRIPKKFIRKYGGDMSNPMFLKPPDGTKWEVFWTENDGDIWLQKSRSDTSGGVERRSTEQNPPHHAQTEGTNFEKSKFASVKKESDGFPFRGTQYGQPPCQNTRLKSPVACPQSRNKLKTSTRSGDRSQGTNFGKSKMAAVKKELDEDVDGTSPNTNGALKEADKFASENPFFTVKVRPGSRP